MIIKNNRTQLSQDLQQVHKKIDEMDVKLDKYTNQVLVKLDKVMDELETIRDEQVLITHSQSENSDKIENHDKRIKRVEKHLQFPTI